MWGDWLDKIDRRVIAYCWEPSTGLKMSRLLSGEMIWQLCSVVGVIMNMCNA